MGQQSSHRRKYLQGGLNTSAQSSTGIMHESGVNCGTASSRKRQSLAVSLYTMETRTAISLLSSGKAPGSHGTSAEIYKAGGPFFSQETDDFFQSLRKLEACPQETITFYTRGKTSNRPIQIRKK